MLNRRRGSVAGISLYCHQLDVTRRVRADLDRSSNDLLMSGVSSSAVLLVRVKEGDDGFDL